MEMPKTKYEVGDTVYVAFERKAGGFVLFGPLKIERLTMNDEKGDGKHETRYLCEPLPSMWCWQDESDVYPNLEQAIRRIRQLAKKSQEVCEPDANKSVLQVSESQADNERMPHSTSGEVIRLST